MNTKSQEIRNMINSPELAKLAERKSDRILYILNAINQRMDDIETEQKRIADVTNHLASTQPMSDLSNL